MYLPDPLRGFRKCRTKTSLPTGLGLPLPPSYHIRSEAYFTRAGDKRSVLEAFARSDDAVFPIEYDYSARPRYQLQNHVTFAVETYHWRRRY
ncbi:uncharacterized protein H6S33_012800 [Morchella sextelata]|uniref:uncharacterized protein n=1 Tax=Morchella sextelata TaxID=1174677 RepID=UPI001D03B95C|nr:uncharacterized protein H6S33_012800 [Morchella sextelata]KAH0609314.1 hypothetical protein H6S33_012800 [Morchella sextelata]